MKSRLTTLAPVLLLLLLGLVAAAAAEEERQAISVVSPQPLRTAEVTATGRVLPLLTTLIGSRLAAHIVEWGKNEAGEPLDVGMAVKTGQMLFSIDPRTFKARVDAAQAGLNLAQAALENLKAPTRKERLDVLRTGIAELDSRIKDREHDEARYRRLVEVERAVPMKNLEVVQLELTVLKTQRLAAQARLEEALAGPTPTEIAVAEARVKEAETALAAAQIDVRDTVVKAPFDAVITRRAKGLGDYVAAAPFIEVLELTTVDRLEAELRLPEAYFAQVVPGKTRLALRSLLLPKDLDLTATRIVPEINVQQGTFAFRAAIPPEQRGGLVPGAFVTASLRFDGLSDGLILPQRAVLHNAGKPFVLIASGGKMVRRDIVLGDRLTESVIVRSGIGPDDKVIVGPADQLKDGAPLPAPLLQDKK